MTYTYIVTFELNGNELKLKFHCDNYLGWDECERIGIAMVNGITGARHLHTQGEN